MKHGLMWSAQVVGLLDANLSHAFPMLACFLSSWKATLGPQVKYGRFAFQPGTHTVTYYMNKIINFHFVKPLVFGGLVFRQGYTNYYGLFLSSLIIKVSHFPMSPRSCLDVVDHLRIRTWMPHLEGQVRVPIIEPYILSMMRLMTANIY